MYGLFSGMSKFFAIYLTFLGLFLEGVSPAHAVTISSSPQTFCQPYQATYKVFWHGVFAGTAQHQVNLENNKICLAISEVKPRIPFLPFAYHEESRFQHLGNHILPNLFDFQWVEKRQKNQGQIQFNWQNHQAQQTGTLGQASIPLVEGAQDKLSLIFQIRNHLKEIDSLQPKTQWRYFVIEPKKKQYYLFEILKVQMLKTPIGMFKTVLIKQSAEHSERDSLLWLAIDKDFIPVKITQFKNGKVLTESIISELKI